MCELMSRLNGGDEVSLQALLFFDPHWFDKIR
jgi:hypothetical protein